LRRESANIRSPEVIRRFRHRFVEFSEHGHRIIDSVKGDLSSVSNWLRGEQLRHWKSQQRRWHDKMKEAWREYVNARYGDRRLGKPSCVEERLAYEHARRKKEEAERWAEQYGEEGEYAEEYGEYYDEGYGQPYEGEHYDEGYYEDDRYGY